MKTNKIYTTINEFKNINTKRRINEENVVNDDPDFEKDLANAQEELPQLIRLINDNFDVDVDFELTKIYDKYNSRWTMRLESDDIINTTTGIIPHFLTSLKIVTVWGSKGKDGKYNFGLHVEYTHPSGGSNGTKLDKEYLSFDSKTSKWKLYN